MGLLDDLTPALRELRTEHESRMTDTFDIGVPTGGYTYDPNANGGTGGDVEEIAPLFTTRGYFSSGARSMGVRSSEAGGRTVLEATSELRIPWDADEVPSNAVAVCVEVGPTTPPRMLGRRVRVDGSGGDGSQRTHYPLQVTEVLT